MTNDDVMRVLGARRGLRKYHEANQWVWWHPRGPVSGRKIKLATDWGRAGFVLEEMESREAKPQLWAGEGARWRCVFGVHSGYADTAPEAIMAAAREALG